MKRFTCCLPRYAGVILALCGLLGSHLLPAYGRANRCAAIPAPAPTPQIGASLSAADAATRRRVSEALAKLPLRFEPNGGQTDPRVAFLARGSGYNLFLTRDEAVLQLNGSRPSVARSAPASEGANPLRAAIRTVPANTAAPVLRMKLIGANPASVIEGRDELPTRVSYFIDDDQSRWQSDMATFAGVRYAEVYPGIDLIYYGRQGQLEYDFVVAPGADPSAIHMAFDGADRVRVNERGELVLNVGGSEVRQHRPVIYQQINGAKRRVAGGYVTKGKHRLGFQLGRYDHSKPLVIDPIVVVSGLAGTPSDDSGRSIAVSADGNVYVTGVTAASSFPGAAGEFHTANLQIGYTYLIIMALQTLALLYQTFLGNSYGVSNAVKLRVAQSFNQIVLVIITSLLGFQPFGSSGEMHAQSGSGALTTGNDLDAYVVRLNSTATSVIHSTRLAGSGNDFAADLVLDSADNAYVVGDTSSVNFPTTADALQTQHGGGDDLFITRLDPAGNITYSTLLGGNGDDFAGGIALDSTGKVYVSGVTASTNFPTTAGAFQPAYGGGPSDAFVAKLDLATRRLVYSTFLGGSGTDDATAIAVDSSAAAYVGGNTTGNFPVTAGVAQASLGGDTDAFVAKLNPAGAALVYSTYLGGNTTEVAQSLALDSRNAVYVAGYTYSANFPTTADGFQKTLAGNDDAFVAKLNSNGSALEYATYLGGSLSDRANQVVVDSSGIVYITGDTETGGAIRFPTAGTAAPATLGGKDIFVVKLIDDRTPTIASINPNSGSSNGGTTVTITGTNFAAGATVTFGGVAATAVTVINAGTITAVTAAHAPGVADIVVTNVDGGSARLVGGFTYNGPPAPQIISVTREGKNLLVVGMNFDSGAAIFLNGEKRKTLNDEARPTTTLIGKKLGKQAKAGDKIKVRNADGTESNEVTYGATLE